MSNFLMLPVSKHQIKEEIVKRNVFFYLKLITNEVMLYPM